MRPAAHQDGDQPLTGPPLQSTVAPEGEERIAEAREAARRSMTEDQAVHGVRAMDPAELVVSELVTTAHGYAPGPCLLDLQVRDGAVENSVWDSDPPLPFPPLRPGTWARAALTGMPAPRPRRNRLPGACRPGQRGGLDGRASGVARSALAASARAAAAASAA